MCNISSSKGNQIIKFCQLIEYNIRNIFLRKTSTKHGGEAVPRLLSKKSKLNISLDHSLSKVLYSLFFFLYQVEGYLKTLKVNHRPLVLPHVKFSQKKEGSELVPVSHLLHGFWRKVFLLLCSINWSNFIVWLSLLKEILSNMLIVIVFYSGCEVINFKINFMFLIKPFFLHGEKVKKKN